MFAAAAVPLTLTVLHPLKEFFVTELSLTPIVKVLSFLQFTNVSFPIDFTFFPSVTAVTFDAPLNAPALMLVTAYDSVPTLIVSATFNVFAFLSNPVT